MKEKTDTIKKQWKEYALSGCICVLFFVVLTHLGAIWNVIENLFYVILPLILGMVIAYIINPLSVFLDERVLKSIKKRKARWTISVIVSLIIVFAMIFILLASLIPQLIENIVFLLDNSDTYIEGVKGMVANMGEETRNMINTALENIAGDDGLFIKMGEVFRDNISSILETTSTIGTAAINWLIGVVLATYFLMAKHSISMAFKRLFLLMVKPDSVEKNFDMLGKFNNIFSKYIVCELIEAIIVGAINYIFMILMGMPSALVISVVVGITNLVPTFGPIIGAIIAVFILLLIQPSSIIAFVLFTIVIQLLDGYIIKPKFFGNALDVPGVLILAAIIAFGRLMGVVGMLLAIPVTAILVYLYENMFIEWLKVRRKKIIAEESNAAGENADLPENKELNNIENNV